MENLKPGYAEHFLATMKNNKPNIMREYSEQLRQALLMQVDALERLENAIAEQDGKPLPYSPRTSELRKLLRSHKNSDILRSAG